MIFCFHIFYILILWHLFPHLSQLNRATPKRPRSFRELTLPLYCCALFLDFVQLDIRLFRNLQDRAQPAAIRARVSVRAEHMATVKCATTRHIAQVEVSVAPVRVHATRRKPEFCSCFCLSSISICTASFRVVYNL